MKTIRLTGSEKKINQLRKEINIRLRRDGITCKDEDFEPTVIEAEKPIQKDSEKENITIEDVSKIVKKAGRPKK
jgi:hypothetical protein